MQVLTVKEVVAACRKGLEDGTLLAEARDRGTTSAKTCVYDDGEGHYCAFGIALNAESRTWIAAVENRNYNRLAGLIGNPSIPFAFESGADESTIQNIQDVHDDWMNSPPLSVNAKSKFIALLDSYSQE